MRPNQYYWKKLNEILLHKQSYLMNRNMHVLTRADSYIINYFIENFIEKNETIEYNSRNIDNLGLSLSKKIGVSYSNFWRTVKRLKLDGIHEFFYIINQYVLIKRKEKKNI